MVGSTRGVLQHASLVRYDIHSHRHDLGNYHRNDDNYHKGDDMYHEQVKHNSCLTQFGCYLDCKYSVHVQDHGEVLELLELLCNKHHGGLGVEYMPERGLAEHLVGSYIP